MPACPRCQTPMVRTHRTALQRLLYEGMFQCPACAFQGKRPYRALYPTLAFLLSRYTRCIRCSNANVQRLSRRDSVDWMSWHPISLVCRVTGAPLNRCPACRLQYYDWRPIARAVAG